MILQLQRTMESVYSVWPEKYNMSYDLYFFEPNRLKDFESYEWRMWAAENYSIPVLISLVYIIVVFGLKSVFKKHEPFKLNSLLFCWNCALTVFSVFGTTRTFPEMVYVIRKYGIMYTLCTCTNQEGVSGVWNILFTFSKVLELIDTLFVVLRKQRLILLHWYHHVTVLLYSWYAFVACTGGGRWFITLNFMVHSCMYGYFALRAAKLYVPGSVNITITALQIIQMLIGKVFSLLGWRLKIRCVIMFLEIICKINFAGTQTKKMWGNIFFRIHEKLLNILLLNILLINHVRIPEVSVNSDIINLNYIPKNIKYIFVAIAIFIQSQLH